MASLNSISSSDTLTSSTSTATTTGVSTRTRQTFSYTRGKSSRGGATTILIRTFRRCVHLFVQRFFWVIISPWSLPAIPAGASSPGYWWTLPPTSPELEKPPGEAATVIYFFHTKVIDGINLSLKNTFCCLKTWTSSACFLKARRSWECFFSLARSSLWFSDLAASKVCRSS